MKCTRIDLDSWDRGKLFQFYINKDVYKRQLLTQSAFHSSRRRCGWGRRSLAGVLAAVLLIGTATAVAAPLWEAYFRCV